MAFSRCCFVTFCKQRQRNEQRIIKHAYTAFVLVAVAVKVSLMNSLKPNKHQTNIEQTKARPKKNAAESAENISAMKQIQNIHNDVYAISSQVVLRKSLRLSTHRAGNIRGRTGSILCQKLTLVGRPICRIYSLTLIISYMSHYTLPYKYGERTRNFSRRIHFYFISEYYYFKIIIPLP